MKAIQQIHKKGYVHLDIKPDNIMSSQRLDTRRHKKEFEIVVIDFGIAKKIGTKFTKGQIMYTYPGAFDHKYDWNVVEAMDIWQACLTIFVIENYVSFTKNSSGQKIMYLKDSDDLFPSYIYYNNKDYGSIFRILKENIWKNFDIETHRKNASSIYSCKTFFCAISFGIDNDINNIPSLSTFIYVLNKFTNESSPISRRESNLLKSKAIQEKFKFGI